MFDRFLRRKPQTQRTALSVVENDDTITRGAAAWDSMFRDRANWERRAIIEKALTAYRNNPIARRVIELQTHFALGDGLSATADSRAARAHLADWWNHPLNALDEQIPEWLTEAAITGDLFLLCTLDSTGFLFVRAYPSESIQHIHTAPNDYRQEIFYQTGINPDEGYPAYAPGLRQFMLHFPLNRLVGQTFGESDLVSLLYYINLYKQWLDDRARANYFRMVFSYIVQKAFPNPAEKQKFAHGINANPPAPGSILVVDPDENWGTLAPNLGSFEADIDGLAIKRMIATGAGIPMHYLAEPESSTRTTAESAGTPTFKRFKARQNFIRNAVQRLAWISVTARGIKPAGLSINTPDITERDNSNQALGVLRITQAFAPLYNAGILDAREFVRVVYRYLAETPPDIQETAAPVHVNQPSQPPDPNEKHEAA